MRTYSVIKAENPGTAIANWFRSVGELSLCVNKYRQGDFQFKFHLRRDFEVKINLPADFTLPEQERVVAALSTVYTDNGSSLCLDSAFRLWLESAFPSEMQIDLTPAQAATCTSIQQALENHDHSAVNNILRAVLSATRTER